MVVRCCVATAAFVGLLTASSLAAAQAFTFEPSVAATAGYAATALFQTTTDPTTKKETTSTTTLQDPFVTLAPAFLMTLETPRTIHTLQAAAAGSLPIPVVSKFKDAPPSLAGNVAYTSHIELSELWTLELGGAASAIPVNSFVNSVSASSSTLAPTSSAFSYNFSTNGQETLTRELSPSARLTETGDVAYNLPYEPGANDASTKTQPRATTLTAKGSLGLTQSFAIDTFTGTLTAGYTRFGSVTTTDATTGKTTTTDPRNELLNSLVGTWRRTFTPTLTGTVDLGVLQAMNPDSPSTQLWHPTGGVRVAYDFNVATTSLSYTHGATINVFTPSLDLTDQVILRAALPIGATGLELASSVGYTRSTPLDDNLNTTSATNIYLADLGLTFSPPSIPNLLTSLRGSVNRQAPTSSTSSIGAYTRISMFASVGIAFPDTKSAIASQARMSPAYVPTPTLGSDSTPAPGVQPKPAEIIEEQERETESARPGEGAAAPK